MAPFVITGVPRVGTTAVDPPPRLEINDFLKNEKYFSLYVQALQTMYDTAQNQLLSFFEISGIHGLPHVKWNDSVENPSGYCVHGTVLFPPWHRPYVALFEQVLQGHAVKIATKYIKDKDQWVKAAAELRQPFWDWAKAAVPPAEVISLEKVAITKPNGAKAQVDNPFLRYRFHPIEPTFRDSYRTWQTTVRWPTSTKPDATSNYVALKARLTAIQPGLTRDTFRLFSITTWPQFSNHTPAPGGSTNSLEAIHDNVHGSIGGSGHMRSVPHAGKTITYYPDAPILKTFDPIFYLHHCQVDRLLALWATVTGVWVPGADASTDLTPFWSSPKTYWSSATSRVIESLNYTYPEILRDPTTGKIADAATISKIIRTLYGGSTMKLFPPHSSVDKKGADNPTLLASIAANNPSDTIQEWTAKINCNQYELGGSFSVVLFFGQIPDDPREWYSSDSFVGAFDAFVNEAMEQCQNCRDQADVGIEAFVHLNEAISKHTNQSSFDPEVVVPFLTDNLLWGVLKMDGTVAELPSLQVAVMATPLTLPPEAYFPIAGDPQYYPDITFGRPGGTSGSV